MAPMDGEVRNYQLSDLLEGQEFSFTVTITQQDIDQFARLSGDISPLHLDAEFARDRGFSGAVVHGALLVSYVSRMVGVHLPGQNALLQSFNLKFLSPVYGGDTVCVRAVVDQTSEAANVVILAIYIENPQTKQVLARGKVQVGFTREGGTRE
jgi:acyl dehydratase